MQWQMHHTHDLVSAKGATFLFCTTSPITQKIDCHALPTISKFSSLANSKHSDQAPGIAFLLMPENVLTVSLFVIPSKSLCGMLQVPAVEVWMEPGKGWEPQALISLMSKCLHSKKKPKHTTQTHTLSLSHSHNYTDIKKVLDTTHTTQTNATTYTYDGKPSPKRCHHIRGCEELGQWYWRYESSYCESYDNYDL